MTPAKAEAPALFAQLPFSKYPGPPALATGPFLSATRLQEVHTEIGSVSCNGSGC